MLYEYIGIIRANTDVSVWTSLISLFINVIILTIVLIKEG